MASRNIEIVIAARDQFTGTANKVIGSLNKMDRAAGRVGKGVGQMATGFARAGVVIGAAAITGLGAAAKAAIDFEDAFAGVRKTVDEADLAKAGMTFESLALDFRKMATEIPIAATEFARIGEAAGALGIKAQDIDDFTKTVALLGVTTDLTTDAAASALGKIGTILGFTGGDFENFADILVNLGNKGASVESEIIEITKRFAASGKAAGLSVPQIVAYASAIASAGVQVEAAGSSLDRVFTNIITETANATKKGKAFAEVSGKSFKDWSKIVETDTEGAMQLFLRSVAKLDKFDAAKALKAVGVTNVRDRNAIRLLAQTYEQNLIPALQNAAKSEGALAIEAEKRFDTLANQIQKFKNNLIEAGITVGEGMLPSIKRATEQLTAFLQLPSTKTDLKQLGEDVGKAIDSIDWEQVLSGARTFVSVLGDALKFAKGIFDVLNKLPTEVKAAGLAFIGLNKLSGGLIGQGAGNVLGGLAEVGLRGAGSRLPGVGSLFAQPVRVVNWPLGFGLGGGLGAGAAGAAGAGLGGAALAGGGILAASAAISAAAILGSPQFARSNQLKGQAANLTAAEIAAIKYYEADAAYQRQVILHLGKAPTKADFESGQAKLRAAVEGAEVFGPPKPLEMFGPPAPASAKDWAAGFKQRRDLDVQGALERGILAGFKPTLAAAEATVKRTQEGRPKPVFEDDPRLEAIIKRAKDAGRTPKDLYATAMATLQNNIARDAAKQKAAIDAVKAEAARTTAAAQRTAFAIEHKADVPIVIPAPKVEVINNISATGVTHTTVRLRRYGPTGGSREISEGGGHGPLI